MNKYLLKATTHGGRPPLGQGTYHLPSKDGKPGEWQEVLRPLIMCQRGFHASRPRYIQRWLSHKTKGRRLFLIQVGGAKLGKGSKPSKTCHQKMRFIRELKIPRNVKRRKGTRWGRYTKKDIVEILVVNGIKLTKMPKEIRKIHDRVMEKICKKKT